MNGLNGEKEQMNGLWPLRLPGGVDFLCEMVSLYPVFFEQNLMTLKISDCVKLYY